MRFIRIPMPIPAVGHGPICREACPMRTILRERFWLMLSLLVGEAIPGERSRRAGLRLSVALVAGSAESRRGLAHVLPWLGDLAV